MERIPLAHNTADKNTRQVGRRKVTTAAELEHIAFELFDEQGFDSTTITDIAQAAGISRRTFFHYFPSKNDIPWGDFDHELARMREDFRALSANTPLMDAIRHCLVNFNQVAPEQISAHRRRMQLILGVPALQAHSTLRFRAWRQVIAEYVGTRLGQPDNALAPQTIAHATLGVALAAYEQWLNEDESELTELLDTAMRQLGTAFADISPAQD
ncbi:mycofactocin system transcriptional regulator [Saccharopolyspora sp. ASAGF58]|uniref:mycofactocin system transcriptional regulator n=1 Tax=Saccharopolyspora sp. ASAGF58 TaxID=2719023 RepID=UPI00143FDFA7|nr:mycofactocin system transcriptional regulator [Saccharopolyspora sp. ASAGF58]QIZ37957.1 mycofactocin system transcriptional regulator [Saccharopolyspora sp. ASAGF58]